MLRYINQKNMSPIQSTELDARRDEAERVFSGILGERVSIAFATELSLECRSTLWGFSSAGLPDLIREMTPDRFTQSRPAIMVNDFSLRSMPNALAAASLFDAVAIHEFSHVATDRITAAVCRQFNGSRLRELAAAPRSDEPSQIRWIDHDSRFVRSLLHIAHRLQSRGTSVCLDMAFSHEAYGLSPVAEYADALGDEPSKNSWRPLAEVLATPLPHDFQKLWAADSLRSLKPYLERTK